MSKYFGNRLNGIPTKRAGDEASDAAAKAAADKAAADKTAASEKAMADMVASNKALLERIDKLEKAGKGGDPGGGDDLAKKAETERKAKEQKDTESKKMEKSLKFLLGSAEWLKTNASLLPKNLGGVFEQAEKENYGSGVEKADAIKVGIISEFFSQQVNLDLLTESQKIAIADFRALTKNDKQERAQQVYETIFEPTFEMLKRIKKAEQVGAGNHSSTTDAESAYKEKLIKGSKAHYLREKKNA